jgi:hypothetical protein
MRIRRSFLAAVVAGGCASAAPGVGQAQCCLSELFAGCRKAPAYAVAPVPAPVVAPIAAPIPAPPPPVVVPVQQVSYVPETTYRTQYQCVPVTSYKPSTEIDPCTGCPRECMSQVTQYVQQPVNVPVTQYRAVYSTKYVQMQPGYAPGGTMAAPAMGAVAAPAASPFASAVQTTPQAWGAAGADVPQQLIQPGPQAITAPAMVPAMAPAAGAQQPVYPQQTYQQPVVPQSGTYAVPAPGGVQPQPTAPPTLTPTPSLKPIPELQRAPSQNGSASSVPAPASGATASAMPPALMPLRAAPATPAPSLSTPGAGSGTSGTSSGVTSGTNGMPVLPGGGPGAATGAFPKLLEPTGHTTSWRPTIGQSPASFVRPTAYPTAALPIRSQQ